MRQMPNFGDQRNQGWCVFCGGQMESRDHAPSRVFLDEPYPENLPVLASCEACNTSFSLDEEYLACLVECAKTGSVQQARIARPKVARILDRKDSLRRRLESARRDTAEGIIWTPEAERVRNVVVKLARAHIAYEQNEPHLDEPTSVDIIPLCAMTSATRIDFESSPNTSAWPEVGSRALQRLIEGGEERFPWIEAQPGRYRYLVTYCSSLVRLVIAEYLAAEVTWIKP